MRTQRFRRPSEHAIAHAGTARRFSARCKTGPVGIPSPHCGRGWPPSTRSAPVSAAPCNGRGMRNHQPALRPRPRRAAPSRHRGCGECAACAHQCQRAATPHAGNTCSQSAAPSQSERSAWPVEIVRRRCAVWRTCAAVACAVNIVCHQLSLYLYALSESAAPSPGPHRQNPDDTLRARQ